MRNCPRNFILPYNVKKRYETTEIEVGIYIRSNLFVKSRIRNDHYQNVLRLTMYNTLFAFTIYVNVPLYTAT